MLPSLHPTTSFFVRTATKQWSVWYKKRKRKEWNLILPRRTLFHVFACVCEWVNDVEKMMKWKKNKVNVTRSWNFFLCWRLLHVITTDISWHCSRNEKREKEKKFFFCCLKFYAFALPAFSTLCTFCGKLLVYAPISPKKKTAIMRKKNQQRIFSAKKRSKI